jgi:uroporphyrinogen decarboxylase
VSKIYTSRERVSVALNHREPDRTPCDITIEPTIYQDLCDELGLQYEPFYYDDWNHAYVSQEVAEKLRVDILHIPLKTTPPEFTMDKTKFKDAWGITKRKISISDGSFMYSLIDYPLEEAECVQDILNYPWPSPEEIVDVAGLTEEVRQLYNNTDFALTATFGGNIFERSHYLRGIENFLVDLIDNPEIAQALMKKIMTIQMKVDKMVFAAIGPFLSYMRFNGEDVGTQQGPLISVKLFNDMVRPFLQQEWQEAKKLFHHYNPDGKISIHSCGAVMDFIPLFIDMGADILNPIQPNAAGMNTKVIKELYGDKICFHGGVDTQTILSRGTISDVEQEVKRRLRDLAPGGGYICAPSHNIQHGVPVKNILTMYETIQIYGKYSEF